MPARVEAHVWFEADILREFKISRSMLYRQLRAGVFPIPELPKIDKRHSWSDEAVRAFLAGGGARLRAVHGRSVTKRSA